MREVAKAAVPETGGRAKIKQLRLERNLTSKPGESTEEPPDEDEVQSARFVDTLAACRTAGGTKLHRGRRGL
jgi:hypothetical protein